jgi:hypothetical protein
MSNNRLREIEENLSLLNEQRSSIEKSKIVAAPEDKMRLDQKLRIEVLPEIQKYEEEYWEILASQQDDLEITESEAETAITEMVNQIDYIETSQPDNISNEIICLLRDIRNKLQIGPSEESASAKLKGIISSFPPFIGLAYEAELDTEKFLKNNFPTFVGWIENAKKKLPA